MMGIKDGNIQKDIFVEGSIQAKTLGYKYPKAYKLDTSKIKTFEDLVKILKAMDVTVYDNYSNFDEIKEYLK